MDWKDHAANELQDEKRSRPNVIDHIQFQTELPREENEPTAKETVSLNTSGWRSAQCAPSVPVHSVSEGEGSTRSLRQIPQELNYRK